MTSLDQLIAAIETNGPLATVRAHRKPPLPSRLLRELHAAADAPAEWLLFLASYPLIPSDLAESMCAEERCRQPRIAAALAANPRTPPAALSQLIALGDTSVRAAAAANPALAPRDAKALLQADDPLVRMHVASHPQLSIAMQIQLAADAEPCVRLALARRSPLDKDLAIHLSTDPHPWVRAAILLEADCDSEILTMHAHLDDPVSQALLLARNEAVAPAILDILALSPHPDIRMRAIRSLPPSPVVQLLLAESDELGERIAAAAMPGLPVAIQRLLANDTSPKVRRAIALHPQLDPDVALSIAAADDAVGATALASHPDIPEAVVDLLCEHPAKAVGPLLTTRSSLTSRQLHALFHHPDVEVACLLIFAGHRYDKIDAPRASELANHPAPSVRSFAARLTGLSAQQYNRMASDHCQSVRAAIAANPAAPADLLFQLSADPDRSIAFAAEDALRMQRSGSLTTSTTC